jgi:hypothetical protein
VGFDNGLFDLEADPKKLMELAQDPEYDESVGALEREPMKIRDLAKADAQAIAEQVALIEKRGGSGIALLFGAPRIMPPPRLSS